MFAKYKYHFDTKNIFNIIFPKNKATKKPPEISGGSSKSNFYRLNNEGFFKRLITFNHLIDIVILVVFHTRFYHFGIRIS